MKIKELIDDAKEESGPGFWGTGKGVFVAVIITTLYPLTIGNFFWFGLYMLLTDSETPKYVWLLMALIGTYGFYSGLKSLASK
jgi:hypothetical protein